MEFLRQTARRAKLSLTTSRKQRALSREIPLSPPEAERMHRGQFTKADDMLRSSSGSHFNKSSGDFNLDPAFVAPVASLALGIVLLVSYFTLQNQAEHRREALEAVERMYGHDRREKGKES